MEGQEGGAYLASYRVEAGLGRDQKRNQLWIMYCHEVGAVLGTRHLNDPLFGKLAQ